MVKICKFLLLLHNYKLYSALKYSNPKREINILTLESQLPFLFTFLVMTPSAFLSIRRNNFSIWVSSPKNSSKESLPSKSLSFSAKNFSISFLLILISLRQRWAVIFINEIYSSTGAPVFRSISFHSEMVSLPSLSLSARANIFLI